MREARDFVSKVQSAQYVEIPDMGHHYGHPASWEPQFRAAYTSILESQPQTLPAPPPSLEDLPIVEVAASGESAGDLFAVLLSGDGGWAGIDKEVAAALAARGDKPAAAGHTVDGGAQRAHRHQPERVVRIPRAELARRR